LTVAAMLCGMRSQYAVAQWARERREDDPQLLLDLGFPPGRSPSVATLHRIFSALDVVAFEAALSQWLVRLGLEPAEPLAVDGKSLRGIHGEELPGVHLVSVYALHSGLVLSQVRTTGKGKELPTAKVALSRAPLEGHPVMADALLTQRDVCEQIIGQGGEYLLPVKESQPTLLSDIATAFSPSAAR
jgi:hypothetical protein